ncbi:MAG: hypothetical protein M3342_25190 [Bacteroidota bacterium]|nr:hypothetical protein [Bacteroidota bacterium]
MPKRELSPLFMLLKCRMALNYGIELLINQGNEEALAISAETKEYRNAVKTEVVNGELHIFIKQNL